MIGSAWCDWRDACAIPRDSLPGTRTYCEPVAIRRSIWHPAVVTLDELPIAVAARITGVDWAALVDDEAQRLRALGIEEGAEVRVSHRGVFTGRDPLAVAIGRMQIALRRVHAMAIAVAPAADQPDLV